LIQKRADSFEITQFRKKSRLSHDNQIVVAGNLVSAFHRQDGNNFW